MKNIAIVEDTPGDAALLEQYVDRFAGDFGIPCKVTAYQNGVDFIGDYKPDFDVVFMDIEMPFYDGMATAKKLREIDKYVGIVFVTNMAQYALNGYEVGALDFILKPVTYFNFADKLKKAFGRIRRRQEQEIIINLSDTSMVKVPVSDIYFIEKEKNYMVFHTADGVYRQRGTMKSIEEALSDGTFSKCNIGCLVNLSHVRKTTKTSLFAGREELPVSRQYRKSFMDALMRYLGGQ